MSAAVQVRRVLVQVRGTASRHPWMSSLGAVGIGSGCMLTAPSLISAGQALIWTGLVIAGISQYCSRKAGEPDLRGGVKSGLLITAGGAVLFGSGYALLGIGAVSIAAGVGWGAFTGARWAMEYRTMKRCEIRTPLLLKEGGDNGFSEDG